MTRLFITDLEGPISKNDNAFEITAHTIPKGEAFYTLLSRYDDVLVEVVKKPGYKAGDTLRLILPFLKAYGVTNKKIETYSAQNILLLAGADKALQFINSIMPSFIVSTSYEQYVYALCRRINFPTENVYCTKLDLDKYEIEPSEAHRLKEMVKEISRMPRLEIPPDAKSLTDFPHMLRKAVMRLDEIFWDEISRMKIGKVLKEVNPIGGFEKANSVQDAVERTKTDLSNILYVGDSITDVLAFQKVRNEGGLTVSFNGNNYALREAEIAIMSENAIVTAILADVFNKHGKEGVFKLVTEWRSSKLKKYEVDESLQKRLRELYPKKLPTVEIISDENREMLSEKSIAFRKSVRGVSIGALG
jgi:energy-converting hydrogenase A subunit R